MKADANKRSFLKFICESYLKVRWQISKKWCVEKYFSCDKTCHFSALWSLPWWSFLENLEIDDKFVNKQAGPFIYQTMCLPKTYWEEKVIRTSLQGHFFKNSFCETAVWLLFAIFTGKHLRWQLSLLQNITKFFGALILKNICELLFLKIFMKLRKHKNCW